MGHLDNLYISGLESKSWVANELLDILSCYDLPEHGLDKLTFRIFKTKCEPFDSEVIARLANMCPHVTHLELSYMYGLSEAGRLSMVSLFR